MNENEIQKRGEKYAMLMRYKWKWNARKWREICNAYEAWLTTKCKKGEWSVQYLWGMTENEMQKR